MGNEGGGGGGTGVSRRVRCWEVYVNEG